MRRETQVDLRLLTFTKTKENEADLFMKTSENTVKAEILPLGKKSSSFIKVKFWVCLIFNHYAIAPGRFV